MAENYDAEKWRTKIGPFLQSKLEEFKLLGIERLTIDDLWQFVKETMESKKQDKPDRLHQVVAHVMSLSVNDYMNKLRMNLFKDSDLHTDNSLFR